MHEVVTQPHRASHIIATQAENVRRYGVEFDKHAVLGREAVRAALHARLLAGAALVAIKGQCAHGEFDTVCQEHFPTTSERTLRDWKARAELDLRDKELRGATEKVLLDGADELARREFEGTADHYFAAKPTLMLNAAQEMHLLGNRKERKPSPARPAKKLTAEEQLAKRRVVATENWAACETQMVGAGTGFVLLDDLAVNAQIAFLQRQLDARKRWVGTPEKKRDVDAIHALLNPPVLARRKK